MSSFQKKQNLFERYCNEPISTIGTSKHQLTPTLEGIGRRYYLSPELDSLEMVAEQFAVTKNRIASQLRRVDEIVARYFEEKEEKANATRRITAGENVMVKDLPISVRHINALLNAGIKDTDRLKNLSEEELRRMKGFHRTGVDRLREVGIPIR